ncbi:hypothetical protein [Sphingomonas aracearum]|uniref:Uncharacterized protein n=1 Tax=Sphingomonas aracearum TaxID=2283317 RepID=A0A369VVD4_9SPHN|nr:hypothetical protein [Sphingomonas aracearum]RDE06298.1 hypothetical protein DVW87_00770 [Sphingomonas aracearum]
MVAGTASGGLSARAIKRYLLAMVAGALITAAVALNWLAFLQSRGSLPPPQLANSLCMDEKLKAMRLQPPASPTLLVVGSSVAWRHFNSAAAIAFDPLVRPYNAGFCGAKIDQTARVTSWLTERLGTVRHVALIASPFDFEDCSSPVEPSRFDIADADRLVFGDRPMPFFYARYFDPWTLLHNARGLRAERTDPGAPDPLVQTPLGDGPSEPLHSRGLFYGKVGSLDPACFVALRRTALEQHAAGRRFDVAITPLHQEWVKGASQSLALARLDAGIRAALAGTDARFHPLILRPDADAFYDAIHIRWSSTPAFTRALLEQIGETDIVASRPPARKIALNREHVPWTAN